MRIDGELYDECANGIKSLFNSSQNSKNATENVSEMYLNHSVVRWGVLEVNLASINSCLNPSRDTAAQLQGDSNWGMVLKTSRQVHLEAGAFGGRCIWRQLCSKYAT